MRPGSPRNTIHRRGTYWQKATDKGRILVPWRRSADQVDASNVISHGTSKRHRFDTIVSDLMDLWIGIPDSVRDVQYVMEMCKQ